MAEQPPDVARRTYNGTSDKGQTQKKKTLLMHQNYSEFPYAELMVCFSINTNGKQLRIEKFEQSVNLE